MPKKKQSHPVWFRMFGNLYPMVHAVPDAAAGAALKADFAYFVDGTEPEGLDTLAQALFLAMRPSIDDSILDYQQAVERGRKAVQSRWDTKAYKGIQRDTGCIRVYTGAYRNRRRKRNRKRYRYRNTKAYKGIQGVSGCIQGHTEIEEEKEIEKDIDIETEEEPSPALLWEQDVNRRRQRAIQQLRGYTGA